MRTKNAKSSKVSTTVKRQQTIPAAIPAGTEFCGHFLGGDDEGTRLFYLPASQSCLLVGHRTFDTHTFAFLDRATALKWALKAGLIEPWQIIALTDPEQYLADRKQWLQEAAQDMKEPILYPGDTIDEYGSVVRRSK